MPQNATSAGSEGSSAELAGVIAAAMAERATGENFPVAMRALPARYRQHLMAVYGFARTIDDIGDRAQAGQRQHLMDELQTDLDRLYVSGATAPESSVIRALAPAVVQCAIPQQPFLDLIAANRQDQVITRYQTFRELKGYCVLSANPVGRIVLYVFGQFSAERAELSDRICTALQLAEHWQDVGEDYRAGRIYLPGNDLDTYGCSEAELGAARSPAALRSLMAFETQRARALLDSGAPLVGTLRGFARVAVAGYLAGGRAALAAISQADHDVLSATPRPGKARTAAEMLRTFVTGR
jgi:squalene synthase HpnC